MFTQAYCRPHVRLTHENVRLREVWPPAPGHTADKVAAVLLAPGPLPLTPQRAFRRPAQPAPLTGCDPASPLCAGERQHRRLAQYFSHTSPLPSQQEIHQGTRQSPRGLLAIFNMAHFNGPHGTYIPAEEIEDKQIGT